MASVLVAGTSGEGNAALPNSVAVSHVAASLTGFNPKQTRFIGSMYPRGVWHAGQLGLGAFPGDAQNPAVAIITQGWFLHWENQEEWVDANLQPGFRASSVWWRWLAGVTVDITVFW